MTCNRCGYKLPDSSQFCNRCGAKMDVVREEAQAYESIPPPPRPARRHPLVETPLAPRRVVVSNTYEEPEQQYEEVAEELPPNTMNRKEISDDQPIRNGEQVLFVINPAMYPVILSYVISLLFTLGFGAAMWYLKMPYQIYTIPIFSVFMFAPTLIKHVKFKSVVFILTEKKLEIVTGIISKSSRNIPLRHIQDVFVSETFRERLIGIGDILIDTAAEVGKIRLDNINNPRKYADLILEQLQDGD